MSGPASEPKFGRYRILSAIGEGGMGRVYLAEDPMLARRVAIKVLPPEFAADPERRSRLLHEARAASALNHPNILTVHDLGDEAGSLFVAMEWIDGVTLREWARTQRRSARDSIQLLRQATRALAIAHGAGLVHRDLKPENLMVRHDGLLKILDFGLARSVGRVSNDETMARTMPGTVMGTAPYMSPEQVLGQPVGPPSDVFSLGTILYELLTGVHPFDGESAVETMHRILHEAPPPPSQCQPALPAQLDFVVMKCLAKEPDRRYATAKELDVDLETCERVLGPGARSAIAVASTARVGPRAIAVLPFKNIGGNPDLNYLGVGLADAVITRLSTSPDLVVRATSSIAAYENRPTDPVRVAQELDVTAVLDASFQRAGERFRATARLVESPSGQAIWAGKVDLDFADIFDVQDQVANGIAGALTARLSEKSPGAGSRFTPRPEAYELYLRGQEALRGGTLPGLQRAAEVGERAVELEPRFADGWAFLGSVYHSMSDSGLAVDPKWYEMAEAAFRRALEIDPDHAQGKFYWGMLQLVRGQKREAYRSFVAAHERLANVWLVYHYFGYLFRLCNMTDECLAAELRANEIDPSVPWPQWAMCRMTWLMGRFDRGTELLEQITSRFPHHAHTHGIHMTALRKQGRYAEAVRRTELSDQVFTAGPRTDLEWGICLAKLGRAEEARQHLSARTVAAHNDMDFAADAAALCAVLGDRDAAFAHLQRATELGNDCLLVYEDDALFGGLHEDPRWTPFLNGVRTRVEQYQREFRWPPGGKGTREVD